MKSHNFQKSPNVFGDILKSSKRQKFPNLRIEIPKKWPPWQGPNRVAFMRIIAIFVTKTYFFITIRSAIVLSITIKMHFSFLRHYPKCIFLKKQCCGAGAARSRPFWLEPEPEPKKLRSFGSGSGSGSIIKEDE